MHPRGQPSRKGNDADVVALGMICHSIWRKSTASRSYERTQLVVGTYCLRKLETV